MNRGAKIVVLSKNKLFKMQSNISPQIKFLDDNYNSSQIYSNKLVTSIPVKVIDDVYNYFLIGLILTVVYFTIYFLFSLVLNIVLYLFDRSKLKKGDTVIITTHPWKGYVGKITKVGFLTNNIKITKNLNPYKKIPKKIVRKTVNEIKQT